jgi:hypothetical protein
MSSSEAARTVGPSVVPQRESSEADYTPPATVHAEGGWVGFVTCRICGVAILVNPRETFDACLRHSAWHVGIAKRE